MSLIYFSAPAPPPPPPSVPLGLVFCTRCKPDSSASLHPQAKPKTRNSFGHTHDCSRNNHNRCSSGHLAQGKPAQLASLSALGRTSAAFAWGAAQPNLVASSRHGSCASTSLFGCIKTVPDCHRLWCRYSSLGWSAIDGYSADCDCSQSGNFNCSYKSCRRHSPPWPAGPPPPPATDAQTDALGATAQEKAAPIPTGCPLGHINCNQNNAPGAPGGNVSAAVNVTSGAFRGSPAPLGKQPTAPLPPAPALWPHHQACGTGCKVLLSDAASSQPFKQTSMQLRSQPPRCRKLKQALVTAGMRPPSRCLCAKCGRISSRAH